MIQIIKDSSNLPQNYLDYITSKGYRKVDLDAGKNNSLKGRTIFDEKLKKKKEEYSALKNKLLNDQGHICCYCNARIDLKESSVEHIIPIETDRSHIVEYSNLLIACNGGRKERAEQKEKDLYPLYCDAHRKSSPLPFSPLDRECWAAFDYSIENGSILGISKDAKLLVNVLNLDCNILRTNRLNTLEILFDDNHELITYEELETIWDSFWLKDGNGKFNPYFYTVLVCIYKLV